MLDHSQLLLRRTRPLDVWSLSARPLGNVTRCTMQRAGASCAHAGVACSCTDNVRMSSDNLSMTSATCAQVPTCTFLLLRQRWGVVPRQFVFFVWQLISDTGNGQCHCVVAPLKPVLHHPVVDILFHPIHAQSSRVLGGMLPPGDGIRSCLHVRDHAPANTASTTTAPARRSPPAATRRGAEPAPGAALPERPLWGHRRRAAAPGALPRSSAIVPPGREPLVGARGDPAAGRPGLAAPGVPRAGTSRATFPRVVLPRRSKR